MRLPGLPRVCQWGLSESRTYLCDLYANVISGDSLEIGSEERGSRGVCKWFLGCEGWFRAVVDICGVFEPTGPFQGPRALATPTGSGAAKRRLQPATQSGAFSTVLRNATLRFGWGGTRRGRTNGPPFRGQGWTRRVPAAARRGAACSRLMNRCLQHRRGGFLFRRVVPKARTSGPKRSHVRARFGFGSVNLCVLAGSCAGLR